MASRRPKQHFAGLHSTAGIRRDEETEPQLFVLGLPATIFSEESVANSIDQGGHLQPHPYEHSIHVDRYDVRLLLDDLIQFKDDRSDEGGSRSRYMQHRSRRFGEGDDDSDSEEYSDDSGDEDEDEQSLDKERYRDLRLRQKEIAAKEAAAQACAQAWAELRSDNSEEWSVLPPPPRHDSSIPVSFGQGTEHNTPDVPPITSTSHSLHFPALSPIELPETGSGAVETSRGAGHLEKDGSGAATGGTQCDQQLEQAVDLLVEKDVYIPRFAVPDILSLALPRSERQHKILVQTARFVHSHGGQVEVLMRLKQGSNPLFAFLSPENPMHAYYRWVVDTNPQELVKDAAPKVLRSAMGRSAPHAPAVLTNAASRICNQVGSPPAGEEVSQGCSPTFHHMNHIPRLQLVMMQTAAKEEVSPEKEEDELDEGGALGGLLGAYNDDVDEDKDDEQGEGEKELDHEGGGKVSNEDTDDIEDDSSLQTRSSKPLLPFGPRLPVEILRKRATIGSAPVLKTSLAAKASCEQEHAAISEDVHLGISKHEEEESPSSLQEESLSQGDEFIGPCLPHVSPASPEPEVPGMESESIAILDDDPPEEVRTIVDKLVGFVARNGAVFEATVRQREACNPKFSFLLPWNPAHSYYRKRLVEVLGPEQAEVIEKQQQLEQDQIAELEAACDVATEELKGAPEGPPTLGPALDQSGVLRSSGPTRLDPGSSHPPPYVKKPVTSIRLNPSIRVPTVRRHLKQEKASPQQEGEIQSLPHQSTADTDAMAEDSCRVLKSCEQNADREGGPEGEEQLHQEQEHELIEKETENVELIKEDEKIESCEVAASAHHGLSEKAFLLELPQRTYEANMPSVAYQSALEDTPKADEGTSGKDFKMPPEEEESLEAKQHARRQRARELLMQKHQAEKLQKETQQRSAVLNHRRAFLSGDDEFRGGYASQNDSKEIAEMADAGSMHEEAEHNQAPLPSLESLQQKLLSQDSRAPGSYQPQNAVHPSSEDCQPSNLISSARAELGTSAPQWSDVMEGAVTTKYSLKHQEEPDSIASETLKGNSSGSNQKTSEDNRDGNDTAGEDEEVGEEEHKVQHQDLDVRIKQGKHHQSSRSHHRTDSVSEEGELSEERDRRHKKNKKHKKEKSKRKRGREETRSRRHHRHRSQSSSSEQGSGDFEQDQGNRRRKQYKHEKDKDGHHADRSPREKAKRRSKDPSGQKRHFKQRFGSKPGSSHHSDSELSDTARQPSKNLRRDSAGCKHGKSAEMGVVAVSSGVGQSLAPSSSSVGNGPGGDALRDRIRQMLLSRAGGTGG